MPLGSSAGVGSGVDLKDTEEVKDYLENLGIEYRFGCYHEKNPKSCHLLGDYWESIKKDFSKAFKTYETNCLNFNHGHSCYKAGGYKMFGKGCTKDCDVASDYYRRGCEGGYHNSCMTAGLIELSNFSSTAYSRTVPQDPVKGMEYMRKACDEGEIAEACYRYGAYFIKGMQNVISKNMEKAFLYNLKGCELGNMAACMNVTMMYRKGDGVEKNELAAQEYGNIVEEMMKQLREAETESVQFGQNAE